MSRCFPFPPPGYEKKDWAENINLLAKEKHKDKKHKSEKREKEKKEHREKKDRGHSKDKHKEKKDRKEKRKDRKKDKDRYKSRTPESRAEERTESYNELHIQESWKKAEEGKDSKFAEESGRRIRDDGKANRMVGSFNSSIGRKIGDGAACASAEKERVADKKIFPVHNTSGQRRNDGSGLPVDNVASSLQRATSSISPATSMEKERGKTHEKVTSGSGTEQSRNHRISRPMESSISGLVDRKTECSTTGMEKERAGHKNVVSYSIAPTFESGKLGTKIVVSSSPATQRRNDPLGLSVDNLSSIHCKSEGMANSSAYSRIGGMGTVPAMEKKERAKCSQLFPHPVSSEQKRNTSFGQPLEKDRYQKVERNDKNEVKKTEDRKGLEDRDQSEKGKTKEERHSKEKKKEEKIANKVEDIEYDKLRNLRKKDQVNALNSKLLAPHKDNTTGIVGVDGTTKKRKDLETNGFLLENDAQPNKIARMTTFSQPLVNGSTMELHIAAPSSLPLNNGAVNNLKPDRILVINKESMINGTAKPEQLPVEVKPPATGGLAGNGAVTLKLHPDSNYLSQIYTVPKIEELSVVDDQDWLFNCCDSQQKIKTDAEDTPQVWAEALCIDSADGFALPYVVPF